MSGGAPVGATAGRGTPGANLRLLLQSVAAKGYETYSGKKPMASVL